MSDNSKHIDEKDIFSRIVKEKLENHELPLDESIWKGIEQKTAPPPKRIIPPVWYWISGSVAAAVALLLLIKPFSNSEFTPSETIVHQTEIYQPDSTQQPTAHQQNFASANVPETISETSLLAENKTNALQKISAQAKGSKNTPLVPDENLKKEMAANLTENFSENQDEKSTIRERAHEKQDTGKPETDQNMLQGGENATIAEITSLPDLNDYPEIPAVTRKPERKRPLLLAAAVGSLGGFTVPDKIIPQNNTYMASPHLVKREIESNYATVLNANDYSEARHDPPISAGITLVKPLNKTFSVESGLVYTYLKSDYFRPGDPDFRGVLQLHYLGIPLNVRASLIDQPKWNLYISAGGMLEKGLRSNYEQEIKGETVTTNTDVNSGIEGVQWSLQGALGVDYQIQKDLSLFLEPKLIYYLRNNQPRSARTEQPLTIGLSGGLRIEL